MNYISTKQAGVKNRLFPQIVPDHDYTAPGLCTGVVRCRNSAWMKTLDGAVNMRYTIWNRTAATYPRIVINWPSGAIQVVGKPWKTPGNILRM